MERRSVKRHNLPTRWFWLLCAHLFLHTTTIRARQFRLDVYKSLATNAFTLVPLQPMTHCRHNWYCKRTQTSTRQSRVYHAVGSIWIGAQLRSLWEEAEAEPSSAMAVLPVAKENLPPPPPGKLKVCAIAHGSPVSLHGTFMLITQYVTMTSQTSNPLTFLDLVCLGSE